MKKEITLHFAVPVDKPLTEDNITHDLFNWFSSENFVYLGEASAVFEFDDPEPEEVLSAQIEAISKAESKLKADFQVALDKIQTARNNLLSISYKKED